LHTVPSTSPEQLDGPLAAASHVPSLPSAALQLPEQQSPARLQTSPDCAQKELLSLQEPPLHSFEQHWSFWSHALPLVRQLLFNA
jgi:hypothetical protein